MRPRSLLALTLLVACASAPPLVAVRRNGGIDGAWSVQENDVETRLDVSGEIARLHFAGRLFELHGVRDLRGMISPEQVDLLADRFHLYATLDDVHIRAGGKVTQVSMAKLPRRVRYENGSLQAE